jgi:hypothetical protein
MALCHDGKAMMVISTGTPLPRKIMAGPRVAVSVQSPDGRPAAGVEVEWKPEGLPNLPRPFGRIRTDEAGRAEFWLPMGYSGLAWIPDPAHKASLTKVPPSGGEILLTWEPEPSPFLQVTDAYGREISGARLAALPLSSLAGPLSVVYVPKGAVSVCADVRGRLPLPSSQGEAGGWIAADGYTLREMPSLPLSGDRLVLQAAQAFPACAVDSATGKPATEVHWATSFNPSQISWVTLDQEGVWKDGQGWLAPSGYPCTLTVSKKGFVARTLTLDRPVGPAGLLVKLEPGIRIGGKILDSSGNPVAVATILAGDLRAPIERCKSNEAGDFLLPPLGRGDAPYTLLVKAQGFLDKTVGSLPAKDTSRLRIVLDRGGLIQGRTVYQDTLEPAAGATVAIRALSGSSSQGAAFQKTTDERGAFLASGLDDGVYEIRAWVRGAASQAAKITIGPQEVADLGEIPLSSHPRVFGTLDRPDGESVSDGAAVTLVRRLVHHDVVVPTAPHELQARLGLAGAFAIDAVPEGDYRLTATDGTLAVTKDLSVGQDDVDLGALVLQPMARLRGHLMGRGENYTAWRLSLMTQAFDERPLTVTAEETGHFDFGAVPAGQYRLEAYPPFPCRPRRSNQSYSHRVKTRMSRWSSAESPCRCSLPWRALPRAGRAFG